MTTDGDRSAEVKTRARELFFVSSLLLRGNSTIFRFSADVIRLCKLGFHHVGAHARCEIVCKSMPFLSAHVQSLRIIRLSNGYFPRK